MNRLAVPLIALIALGPTTTRAQLPQSAILYAHPDSSGCPVGLRAQRGSGAGTMIASNRPQNGIEQQLHMTLTNSKSNTIVAIQITVHGFPAKARLVPTVSSASHASDLEKTINLNLTVEANQQASTDLRLRAFTAVSRLDVDSVDYADGSGWHASAQQSCHIEPDGFMLVSSR
jgi:hypothetical protein